MQLVCIHTLRELRHNKSVFRYRSNVLPYIYLMNPANNSRRRDIYYRYTTGWLHDKASRRHVVTWYTCSSDEMSSRSVVTWHDRANPVVTHRVLEKKWSWRTRPAWRRRDEVIERNTETAVPSDDHRNYRAAARPVSRSVESRLPGACSVGSVRWPG